MEKIHCEIHNLDIIIYNKDEEHLFIDNNKEEVAIFYNNDGNKYLKRYIIYKCDENCETIKQILEE
jgi:hypothetical protein